MFGFQDRTKDRGTAHITDIIISTDEVSGLAISSSVMATAEADTMEAITAHPGTEGIISAKIS